MEIKIDLKRMPPSAMVILERALDEAAEFCGVPASEPDPEDADEYKYWEQLRDDVEGELCEIWPRAQILRTIRFVFAKRYRKTFLSGFLNDETL